MTKESVQITQNNCSHNRGFLFLYKTLTHAYTYQCALCNYEMNFSAAEAGKIRDSSWGDQIVSHPNDLIVKEWMTEETIEGATKGTTWHMNVRRS